MSMFSCASFDRRSAVYFDDDDSDTDSNHSGYSEVDEVDFLVPLPDGCLLQRLEDANTPKLPHTQRAEQQTTTYSHGEHFTPQRQEVNEQSTPGALAQRSSDSPSPRCEQQEPATLTQRQQPSTPSTPRTTQPLDLPCSPCRQELATSPQPLRAPEPSSPRSLRDDIPFPACGEKSSAHLDEVATPRTTSREQQSRRRRIDTDAKRNIMRHLASLEYQEEKSGGSLVENCSEAKAPPSRGEKYTVATTMSPGAERLRERIAKKRAEISLDKKRLFKH